MSVSEHRDAATPDADRRSARTDPAAALTGNGDLSSTVLAMQRTVGNRAVARMLAPASGRTLQRRRLPPRAHSERLLVQQVGGVTVDAPDAAEHRAGIERLIGLGEGEMSPAQRARVTTLAHAGTTAPQWAALSQSERDLREADAIMHVQPSATMTDPAHIVTGPRAGTRDRANLASVVAWANRMFAQIASGALDTHIGQVFGATNVAAAKQKYQNGHDRMNELFALVPPLIVTDRSGYNAEAGVGGATTHEQIMVETSVFDDPTSRGSVVTLIHESLHAGNADVGDDGGYIYRADEFTTAQPATKLTNAAHFEVVPRRMLGMGARGWAYPGQTFVPAALAPPPPPPVGPAPPPPPPVGPQRTPRQEAIHNASEAFRISWAIADDVHRAAWTELLQHPDEWNTADLHASLGPGAAPHFADTLPFLSKVLGMTIHRRGSIDPTSADPARQPVTEIDVGISEAVVRQVSHAMDAVPASEADAVALETARASPVERGAATTVPAETELLIKCVLRRVGPITTTPERDVHVVQTLSEHGEDLEQLLRARAPAACTF
jgi:hypothetical protein